MQAKTTKKISRSAVATVLATSSVALGLPAEQTNAAQYFKDVKTTDFFYSAVNELAENKIVNGYGDGTFRPLNNVTRGEAAKMLALALKLDVANAETKQFKDVKKGDIFYKYIAALANKGIINGYPDGSFKPNEVVQRGSMAKMVALGYEFTLAKNFTHPFKDVDQKHIFNQHIQTLVNLNITKGTSFNTFSPGKAVTRGELATFISRASKANAGKPIYVVDNIIGNKIYINSVGYTIGANVASYIKVENKSALIGAHVEGTFNGMTLTNVTKLTLNATGNTNSIYTFDGGNSTYNGTLVVNGSYLKFKNWTLNGQTIVSETPRKSLAQYNRLSEIKIASLASGFIDFTKPTNPDDGNLNNGSNSGSLNSGTSGTGTPPYAPYNEKLAQIHKYVDFTNVTVRSLFVEQNRTYIAAQKEIAMVTVRRDVEFVELNFNMRNLYIEGDESLTLYGTHDISTVYKNSLYSVFFNSKSDIDTLIVDNSNGWIDLGDYVEIDKVIIPPKTTPNDIFDDYKNDNDKIGNIEDDTGKEVDRNPIENGIVPDVTPPELKLVNIKPDSDRVSVTVEVNETGILYYLVLPENEPEPSIRQIVNSAKYSEKGADFKKIGDDYYVSEGKYVYPLTINELVPETKYKVYLVYADNEDNFSGKVSKEFATVDGTSPYFIEYRAEGMKGGRRIQFDFKASETGKYYYFVDERLNPDPSLEVEDIMVRAETGRTFGNVQQIDVDNGKSIIIDNINGNKIKPETDYVLYAVLIDDSGNEIEDVESFQIRTKELDETPPTVKDGILRIKDSILNEFYIEVSEELDKVSAENIENYVLTGTGIINYGNQREIRPEKVVYDEVRKHLVFTIPSFTGFVHGDNLVVTILPAVKDLADNDFENNNNLPTNVNKPRNQAEYLHSDMVGPGLTLIGKPQVDPLQTKALLEFNATKAGTYHYLIMESGIDKTLIDPRELIKVVQNPWPSPTTQFNVGGTNYDVVGRGGNYPAQLGNQTINVPFPNKANLDPFKSYDIYIVLRDRSGNYSLVENATLIADSTAPTITGPRVIMNAGDRTGRLEFRSNEEGTVYYLYRKIDEPNKAVIPETKRELLNYLIENGTEQRLRSDVNHIEFRGLNRHEDYEVYFAVVDIFGNSTIYENEVLDASGNTNHGQLLKYTFYSDGTTPKVNEVIRKRSYANEEFEVTFSEKVHPDGPYNPNQPNFNFILIGEDGTTPIATSSYTTTFESGTNSWDESKLIIKFTDASLKDKQFKLKVTVDSKDLGSTLQHPNQDTPLKFEVGKDIAEFKYRKLDVAFDQIYLKNPLLTDGSGGSKAITATVSLPGTSLGYETNESVTYYARAYTKGTDITVKTPDMVKNEVLTASGAAVLGAQIGKIKVGAAREDITLTDVKFLEGDQIVLVAEDKYGNMQLISGIVGPPR